MARLRPRNTSSTESPDSWLLFLVLAKTIYPKFSKQMFLRGEGELNFFAYKVLNFQPFENQGQLVLSWEVKLSSHVLESPSTFLRSCVRELGTMVPFICCCNLQIPKQKIFTACSRGDPNSKLRNFSAACNGQP